MKKFLYSASVVLFGAGLAVAQCSPNTAQQNNANPPAAARDYSTPSTLNPQTSSPDSVSRWNPVTGQNSDSQRNPNAESSSSTKNSADNVAPQPKQVQPDSVVTIEQGSTSTTTTQDNDSGSDTDTQ